MNSSGWGVIISYYRISKYSNLPGAKVGIDFAMNSLLETNAVLGLFVFVHKLLKIHDDFSIFSSCEPEWLAPG